MSAEDIERRIARAARVQELADGEGGLRDMIEKIRKTHFKAFCDPATTAEDREAIHHRTVALDDVLKALEAEIQSGLSAAASLKAKRGKQ